MVRPKNTFLGYKEVPLDEISRFRFTDSLNTSDAEYKAGFPSQTEQAEILRFYNHWGFLQLPEEESEPASIIIRSMRTLGSLVGLPNSNRHQRRKDTLFGQPKLLMHTLS